MRSLLARARSLSRRRLLFALGAGLVLVLVAWDIARLAAVRYPRHALLCARDAGLWRGAYHVHTRASEDAFGSLDDVARAARDNGLAWVVVMDHNIVHVAPPEYRQGVLLVTASEAGTRAGHVGTLGASRGLTRVERRGTEPLARILRLGGAPIAAHPLNRKRPYRDLGRAELAGLEILSLDDAFRDALHVPADLWLLLRAYPVNRRQAVVGLVHRPAATLRVWDELLRTQRLAAFAALDAHGRPPYAVVMGVLSMYARVGVPPSGDAARDAQLLIASLRMGRSLCALDALARADGLRFSAVEGSGAVREVGEDVALDKDPVLRVALEYERLPPGLAVRLICAGVPVPVPVEARSAGHFEYRPREPAACRVEVGLLEQGESRPWILSNPIYVR